MEWCVPVVVRRQRPMAEPSSMACHNMQLFLNLMATIESCTELVSRSWMKVFEIFHVVPEHGLSFEAV